MYVMHLLQVPAPTAFLTYHCLDYEIPDKSGPSDLENFKEYLNAQLPGIIEEITGNVLRVLPGDQVSRLSSSIGDIVKKSMADALLSSRPQLSLGDTPSMEEQPPTPSGNEEQVMLSLADYDPDYEKLITTGFRASDGPSPSRSNTGTTISNDTAACAEAQNIDLLEQIDTHEGQWF